jgi:hypothetical protein
MAKKKPFKPTAAQAEIIDVLAHVLIMKDIDKNVPGFQGAFDQYFNGSLNDQQRGIYSEFLSHVKNARKDLVELFKQDQKHG